MQDEEDIIAAVQKGKASFELLYNKYFESVFRFVYSRVESKQLAQDLTADVFVKVYQNIHKYKNEGKSFGGWLYRVAYNETMTYYRKNKKQKYVELNNSGIHHLSEELVIEEDQVDENFIKKIFNQLKNEEVELLRMRFLQGIAFKEMGEFFNMKESTVKMKVYRIIEKVKKLEFVTNFNK